MHLEKKFIEKTCSKCGETKSRDSFPNNSSAKDGKDYRCKSCANKKAYDKVDKRHARSSAAFAKFTAELQEISKDMSVEETLLKELRFDES